jgi:8-oxo-dGTP pyrophosphatase MutT (NUDIX family)
MPMSLAPSEQPQRHLAAAAFCSTQSATRTCQNMVLPAAPAECSSAPMRALRGRHPASILQPSDSNRAPPQSWQKAGAHGRISPCPRPIFTEAMANINNLAAILSIITGLIACTAFLAATGAGSRIIIFLILAGARLRTVIRTAKHAGLTTNRMMTYKCLRHIVRLQYTGSPYTLAIEMEWLCQLYETDLPITMSEEQVSRSDLQRLAAAYQQLAGHCRTRLLFGARGNDVVAQQARIADQASRFLQLHSLHMPQDYGRPADIIDLRSRGSYIKLFYAQASMDCIVSPHPSRQPTVPTLLSATTPSAKPRFEGILPFLLRHQMELDGGSGRTLLHLGIGEIPYSNLLSRNIHWDPQGDGAPEQVTQHAISLAVLPVTSDARILLSRRAATAGSYAGMIGPYITGNAELRDRRGLAADRDEFGIPDLFTAACREGMEEVGLPLERHVLKVLGLGQMWSSEDTGIFTLLLSATMPMTAEEAAQLTRNSDPVEGSWEVGNELYAVSLWEDDRSVEEVLRWIAADVEVVPQAVACVAALAQKTDNVRFRYSSDILEPQERPERLIKVFRTRQPYR